MRAAKKAPHAGRAAVRSDAELLVRLRDTTADAHRRVEARLFPSGLADEASYRTMLQVLLALHEPLETRLATVAGFAALGVDPAARRKSPRLRADLAAMGVASPDVPKRPAPPVDDLATALGVFYVLEGSTLGGRVLMDQVRTRLGAVPVGFLAGYGDDTGRYWRRTRTALVDGVSADPDPVAAAERLVAGASATFDHLDGLLDDCGWPAPGREAREAQTPRPRTDGPDTERVPA